MTGFHALLDLTRGVFHAPSFAIFTDPAGGRVAQGTAVVLLEAMKTEATVFAQADGILGQPQVQPGERVDAGAMLARIRRDVE